eukprot:GHVU01134756.1.p1 GENE.GHVU01134756.1~~GHVU01134756.1.p1  ORF type:complete len:142 (-),score=9.69 GHVU01134756.1:118-492(-)
MDARPTRGPRRASPQSNRATLLLPPPRTYTLPVLIPSCFPDADVRTHTGGGREYQSNPIRSRSIDRVCMYVNLMYDNDPRADEMRCLVRAAATQLRLPTNPPLEGIIVITDAKDRRINQSKRPP